MSKRVVTVTHEGKNTTHIAGSAYGSYHTFCGLDLDDKEVNGVVAEVQSTKADCEQCFALWKFATSIPAKVFTRNRSTKRLMRNKVK